MPELTKEHLERLTREKEVEVIIKKNKLLKNDDSYGEILDGITKAYKEVGEDIPEEELNLVVRIVSEMLLPENNNNLKDYYYGKTKFAYLRGGGRRKRKSRKRKSRTRRR